MELYLQSPQAFMTFCLNTGRENFTDLDHEMIPRVAVSGAVRGLLVIEGTRRLQLVGAADSSATAHRLQTSSIQSSV